MVTISRDALFLLRPSLRAGWRATLSFVLSAALAAPATAVDAPLPAAEPAAQAAAQAVTQPAPEATTGPATPPPMALSAASPPPPRAGFIGPQSSTLRCTPDRRHCIAAASYYQDTCALIGAAAREARIDQGYLARLLWRESRYDPQAISRAGAQGIAQFMPGTARLRGLEDPFNPAAAIWAAALYLGEMIGRYGNPGLAAVGYNGGEARVEAFIARRSGLAPETLAYVRAITGHSAEDWRDRPPKQVDYRLDASMPFGEACFGMASQVRRVPAMPEDPGGFRDPPPPWGVIIAAGRNQRSAQSFGRAAAQRHKGLIDAAQLRFIRTVVPGLGRVPQYTAALPATSQDEAMALCAKLRARNGFCKVMEN